MEKEQYRAVIRFLFLEGKTVEEIKVKLDAVYRDHTPSMTTVRYWFNEFKRGRTSIFDEQRPGRPTDVATDEIVGKVHDIIFADRRTKVREVAEAVRVSYGTAINILRDKLGMRKLAARWVPRLLTADNKRMRVTTSKQCLDLFTRNPSEFLRRVVTVDETWIHHYTPETKQQSKQWTFRGESAPKKAKSVPSAGKVMATIFWDAKGIILIDFLPPRKTITGQYYSGLLDRFDAKLKETRPHLAKKKVLFHHDNAPAHTSHIVAAKLHQLRYDCLPHPPYSPDLAPCDFYLFPNLKTWLAGKRFGSNEEVIAETEVYFASLEKSYFSEGLKKWQGRWEKCVALKGDYVEK